MTLKDQVVSLKEAKKNPIAGTKFYGSKGVIGTILDGLSKHGKLLARMSCSVSECTETHERERSDWHQCHQCRTHGKHRSKRARKKVEAEHNPSSVLEPSPTSDNRSQVDEIHAASLAYSEARIVECSNSELFIGWDVGAWNCERNPESRDALCAIEMGQSGLKVLGNAWRGNLREHFVNFEGRQLIKCLARLVGITLDEKHHVTIAIDTPLAWPKSTLELLQSNVIADVPDTASGNPYLFRLQERELFDRGFQPLSMVRDMIGSQSTKGIHFLQRADLQPKKFGEWSRESTAVIETYPAVAVRNHKIAELTSQLFPILQSREKQSRSESWQSDVRDATICALIAWLYRHHRSELTAPGIDAIASEGWIWLPVALSTQ